ncbi:MAG: hypothetical protein EOM35_07590 [Negativicutes bacterium]|nr:hypothetical protein [Negativicutes bacterium]
MKRIEVLSLNTILNPIKIDNLSDDALLKVIKLKSALNKEVEQIESDRKLFTDETKPSEFTDGVEMTDEIKDKWESKFQPIYGKYLVEESSLTFDKLTDAEFVELKKGSSLTVETVTLLYNILVK